MKSNLELAIKHYQENPKEGVRNVSKKFHISYEKLLNSLKEKGVEIIQPKRLDFLDKYVDAKLDYLNGDSLSKISKRRNISKTSLRSELLKDGIVINTKIHKKEINENSFSILDEETMYWLGFLYADGCVLDNNVIQLSISVKDLEHLKKFKKYLGYKGDIKFNEKTKSCKISFMNSKIASNLKKLGCVPRKTHTVKFNEKLKQHKYTYAFIRGYIDGDGYISKDGQHLEICGTKDFLEDMAIELGIIKNIKPCKSIYRLRYNTIDAYKVYNIIYNNQTIYLERKFNHALPFL